MRLLLLGGTFNPVHIGHLILAEEVREEFGYDLVLLVPSARPPHKAVDVDPGPAERLAMLRLAIASNPSLAVDDCELARPGLSYTVDTLRGLSGRYAFDGRPGLIIGDDLAPGFPSWREPEAIVGLADIIVARRGGVSRVPGAAGATGSEGSLPWPCARANNRLIPISSSEIRERLASGLSVRYLLPDSVLEHIRSKGLYGCR